MDGKKSYRIVNRCVYADNKAESSEERENAGVYRKTVKRMIGIALIILAAVFGGLLASVPTWAAFVTVFAYISAQVGIWTR